MLVTFNIIIDDIVHPDGSTSMNVLGGGGPQTAFGMRLFSEEPVGLSAGIGTDLPDQLSDWLEKTGIDLSGLRVTPDLPTPRAWQAMEMDGKRTQVWRMPAQTALKQLRRDIKFLSKIYQNAVGFHFGVHPNSPDYDFIQDLRNLTTRPLLSIETFLPAYEKMTDEEISRLFTCGDIFSVGLEEAVSILGPKDPGMLLQEIIDRGAEVVTLRMGEKGALAGEKKSGRLISVPAVPVKAVDPVGAGNAFCGGFLSAWIKSRDLAFSAQCAAVAASFMVEQVGLPVLSENLKMEAEARLNWLRERSSTASAAH